MTEEKWLNLISMLEENFGEIKREKGDLPEDEGLGQRDMVEFKGPLGKMRLIRTIRPLVLDKKTVYSKRGGSETKVDYVYSDEEKVTSLKAERFNESQNAWQEIDSNTLINNT